MSARLQLLVALMAALGAFIAWDATRDDAALADVAEAVPHEHRPGVDAATPALAPEALPTGPRAVAVAVAGTPADLFRPLRSASADAPPPSEHEDPDSARVVGVALEQGRWVALVEHAGQTHWLAPGRRVGGLRVDRVTAQHVQVTDLARGTPQTLDLSPDGPMTGPIVGLHTRPHDD